MDLQEAFDAGFAAVKRYVDKIEQSVGEKLDALRKEIADMPPPKDGRDGDPGAPGRDGLDGKDGADGFGFDDLSVEYDGKRGFTFKFAKGERVKEFPFSLPVVLDAGIYKSGGEYEAGDGVTHGGSFWIAQKETAARPGDGSDDWRLSVKRGRDGKSAQADEPREPVQVRLK